MKYIKSIIIGLIIIIIIVIIIIMMMINKQDDQQIEEQFGSNENNADTTNIDIQIKEVDNSSLYFTVSNCFDEFFKVINMNIEASNEDNYIPGGEISESELLNIQSDDEKRNIIYDLLDKNYIEENNINISDIGQVMQEFTKNSYNINKMYIKDGERIKRFYLYISFNDGNTQLVQLSLDTQNLTFMIRPMEFVDEEELINMTEFDEIESIEENSNNKFEYARVSEEEMAKRYFNDFKIKLVTDTENAYNLLDEEYRNKRFKGEDNFIKYVNDNQDLQGIQISKYLVNNYDNYKEYVCKDQYDNLYIFKETAIMDYTIQLDTYTLSNDTFTEEYNKVDNEEKIKMDIDKFIQMINRQDYITSYDYISDGFKNNYFKTQTDFENFIKERFFKYNNLQFNSAEQRGNNLYTCNITLSDLTNENSENKNITIIIQLNEDLDFEIAFGM